MGLRITKTKMLVAAFVVAAIAAGIGTAAWSVSGSGSGYAKAATASSLVLTDASAFTSADLFPGAANKPLYIRVSNPNPFPVRITTVTVNSPGAVTTSDTAGCGGANATGVTVGGPFTVTLDLAANAPATTLTVPAAVSMDNTSVNACQGAVFAIPVTVTAVSHAS